MAKKVTKKATSESEAIPKEEEAVDEVAEIPVLKERAPLGSKAMAMKNALASQRKVRIMIPLASGEKLGITQSVVLNGYPMYIRKGEYVEVPEQVADVLEIKSKQRVLRENHPSKLGADGEAKLSSYGG